MPPGTIVPLTDGTVPELKTRPAFVLVPPADAMISGRGQNGKGNLLT